MAYFSNGSEGDDYAARYCERCVHEEGCPVWLAHMLHNYRDCNDADSILHILIPRTADGLGNEQCGLFHAKLERGK